MWDPKYTITNQMASDLMKIQEAQAIVDLLPLPDAVLFQLQQQSKEEIAILSTRMDRKALSESDASAEEQEMEISQLMEALSTIEGWEAKNVPITEETIRELHAIVQVNQCDRRTKRSKYRTKRNQVGVRKQPGFYLPPTRSDVPELMEDLVAWLNAQEQLNLVAPIKAGALMYQFLTIHPFIDANGRTARVLAMYVMRMGGLGLKGLFVLERYFERHLQDYYDNLQMGLHHNYYYGRQTADITRWLEFFIGAMAKVFQDTAHLVKDRSLEHSQAEPELLRRLDAEQRSVFARLALRQDVISRRELVALLSVSDRTLRDRTQRWIADGFLAPTNENAQRVHSFTLAPQYQELAREVQADPRRLQFLLSPSG